MVAAVVTQNSDKPLRPQRLGGENDFKLGSSDAKGSGAFHAGDPVNRLDKRKPSAALRNKDFSPFMG